MSDLPSPNQSENSIKPEISPVIVQIDRALNASQAYEKEKDEHHKKHPVTGAFGEVIPPMREPTDLEKEGGTLFEVKNNTEQKKKKELTQKIRKDLRYSLNIEIIKQDLSNSKMSEEERIMYVDGCLTTVVNLKYLNSWQDVVALLAIEPQVLQLEGTVGFLARKLTDDFKSEPDIFKNPNIVKISDILTPLINNSAQKEKLTIWSEISRASNETAQLIKSNGRDNHGHVFIDRDSLNGIFELPEEQVKGLSLRSNDNKVELGQALDQFANYKLIESYSPEDKIKYQSKIFGVLTAYLDTQESPDNSNQSNVDWKKQKNKRAQQAIIAMLPPGESLISAVNSNQKISLPQTLLEQIYKQFTYEFKTSYDPIFQKQHKEALKYQGEQKKIADEEQTKTDKELQEQQEQLELQQRKNEYEALIEEPRYQKILELFRKNRLTDAYLGMLVNLAQKDFDEKKLSETAKNLLQQVFNSSKDYVHEFGLGYDENEVVDQRGILGVGRRTHMEYKVFATEGSQKKIEKYLGDIPQDYKLENLGPEIALQTLSEALERKYFYH